MAQGWIRQPRYRLRQGGVDARYDEIRVLNPSRGLNLLVADILVNDKEATAGTKNIEYDEGGIARKRPGYQTVGDELTASLRGLGSYASEANNYLVGSDAGVLKKLTGGVWSTLAGAVTMDPTAKVSFTSLFEKTYAWDGISGGVVYNGSTVVRPGTMPKAKASVIYKGYHVAFGVDGQPFRLYFAPPKETSRFTDSIVPTDPNDVALNNATEVPGATIFAGAAGPRAIDINKNDGQYVTGVGFFQDVLIVFKERSIYQLYFNSENGFVVERISSSYGCVSHWTIASVENDCYFLSEQGVYVLGNEPNFYASIRTNELSSRMKPLLERINSAKIGETAAIYHDNRYWLTVPIDSEKNNILVIYDRRFYSWAVWDNINADALLAFKDKDGDGATHFYFSDNQSEYVNEFTWGVYNDNGQPINAVFRTRAFEGKMVDREKYWYTIRPIFRYSTGEINISYITEKGVQGQSQTLTTQQVAGIGVDQFGALLFGTSAQDTYTDAELGLAGTDPSSSVNDAVDVASHKVYNVGMNFDSRVCKVEFSNNKLNETFALLGWTITLQIRDLDRFDGAYTVR